MNKNNNVKQLTILHSNDIHADFLGQVRDNIRQGGVSKLKKYIAERMSEQDHPTLYLVAGDLLNGSYLDSHTQGEASVRIMNYISPDAVCLGNHSVDYGFNRLRDLAGKADFPVICSNLREKNEEDEIGKRIFRPYAEIERDGIKILVIGVVTDKILDRRNKDEALNHLYCSNPETEIRNVYAEIEEKINSGRGDERIRPQDYYDVIIILSHIGYDADKTLADELAKDASEESSENPYGIDLIIGGHSHTLPDTAVIRHGIRIVQAKQYARQIGRIDLSIDMEKHKVVDFRWEVDRINAKTVPVKHAGMLQKVTREEDRLLQNSDVDFREKLAELPVTLTQDFRYAESIIGNFFADALREVFDLDIAMVGSGSLRKEELGPEITYRDLNETYSTNEHYFMVTMTGKQLKHAVSYFLTIAPYGAQGEGEYFQFSKGCRFWYSTTDRQLVVASFNGKDIKDDDTFRVGLEDYHYYRLEERFDLTGDLGLITDKEKDRLTEGSSLFETMRQYFTEHNDFMERDKYSYRLEGRTARIPMPDKK